MNPLYIGIGLAAVMVVAGLVLAWRLATIMRARHHDLLTAVQLTQRQLTELRSAQDAISAQLAENSARLAEKIEPELEAVGGYLQSRQTAAEVERARDTGALNQETAERLLRELERLGEDRLAGESPY